MSEPELYMADSNESFDLPRWQTQVDPSVQAAQAHSASAYIYSAAPPPPPQSSQRLQTTQVLNRQPRISQLLEQEQSLGSPYASTGQGQLTRSTSLGGTAGGNLSSSRIRRHHQPDDLEGAFNSDNQVMNSSRQQPPLAQNSFYPASVGYQPPSMSATGSANPPTSPPDPYSDIYYNGSASQQPPKRLQPSYDNNNLPTNRGGRSPQRVPNTPISAISASPLDQYSHQSQYSPTTASYPYNNAVDQRPHPGTYQSHSRNHSQVKNESLTPPIPTAYSSQTNLSSSTYSSGLSGNNYPSSYSMETSSPHPPMQSHVNPQTMSLKPSISTPSTPLSYLHPNSGQSSHYYPQDHSMAVDPPPKRRAPGFRRVRTVHDLQPRLDVSPVGRRMGADGVYLAVRASQLILSFNAHMLYQSIAITIANYQHSGYISHM